MIRLDVSQKGNAAARLAALALEQVLSFDVGSLDADRKTKKVAYIHEHGAPSVGIPQRSFIRATIARNRRKYAAELRGLMKRVVAGKLTYDQAVLKVTETMVADIQNAILKGVPPALEQSTVKAKRRKGYAHPSTPLYASGKLFKSIKARKSRRRAG